jgi:hypothetical protein
MTESTPTPPPADAREIIGEAIAYYNHLFDPALELADQIIAALTEAGYAITKAQVGVTVSVETASYGGLAISYVLGDLDDEDERAPYINARGEFLAAIAAATPDPETVGIAGDPTPMFIAGMLRDLQGVWGVTFDNQTHSDIRDAIMRGLERAPDPDEEETNE